MGSPPLSGGKELGGKPGSKLKLAPSSLPDHSQLTPLAPCCHSQLTPSSLEPRYLKWQLNSLAMYPGSLPPPLGHKGLGGNVEASLILLPSLPSPCSHHSPHSHLTEPHSQCPMNSLLCIWVPHHLWGQGSRGQGGSKLKLAPLTPRLLPSLPSPCCHSPHSELAGPHSQCPMNSLLCIGVSTTSGGKGLGGKHGSKLKLAPLTPKSLLSLPSLPASWTSLPMSNEQLTMYWGLHHLWGQGARG